ncbi:MAG: type II toxin-antitoxin system HicB family antitoxin [Thermodesulfobacteriota bacterium]
MDIFMSKLFKITLVLEPQKEGGWTVISPVLPELIAEVEDLSQIDEVVRDAMNAVIELYEDTGKEFPPGLIKAFKEQNLLFGSNPSSSQGNEL